ncbi:MAG: CoB--CoM heterodisulfide reductase iron-sulfur subunit A family protein [Bacteroidetes bacterium]|nr:CoB--CoM heterodisulfide reductase iron-sulfur subunit A family protein [Bacteroidota bacterium]
MTSDLLIVGAGIAGITAAVEAAETGLKVVLLEKRAYIGGKVTQFNKYFPKLCPPSCGLEINIRRLRSNPFIKLFTLAEVSDVSGEAGKYEVNIKLKPRFVTDKCTSCGDCVQVCPESRNNDFNYGMDRTTSIYLPYGNSYPAKYVIDQATCKGSLCNRCVDVCKYGAIDLSEQETAITVKARSIIWATGWEPYDAKKLDMLGFGKFPDVITNVMMERLAAPDGPTKGKILRPSTNGGISSVAFVQCAGSRDENHLEYCSSVCCMASLKHTRYIREQYPDAEIHVHYIDVRSSGIFEDFYSDVQKDAKVHFLRGKVAKVSFDASGDRLVVEAEDTMTGARIKESVDLVILATGMQPAVKDLPIDRSLIDSNGFIISDTPGMIGCGVNTNPKDVSSVVQEATGSVLKAIQAIKGN